MSKMHVNHSRVALEFYSVAAPREEEYLTRSTYSSHFLRLFIAFVK